MHRLAVPRRGHVVSTVAETFGRPVREAVAILGRSLTSQRCIDDYMLLFGSRNASSEGGLFRTVPELAAWSLVSVWVTGVAVKAFSSDTPLADAENWFFGPHSHTLTGLLSAQTVAKAELALRSEKNESAYLELLPYILDPHGPGSRLSVRHNPQTRLARTRKRAQGVFYTPADVADYMAGACLESIDATFSPTVFDPACGTGVFLRAALRGLRHRYPQHDAFSLASAFLFGADIDPWPLDAAAFVLLADTWPGLSSKGNRPAEAWRRLRRNFACIDTLRIDPVDLGSPSLASQHSATRHPISTIFPALADGPTVILGNPPYADMGNRSDFIELRRKLETVAAKPRANSEIYLSFIEQMIRLAARDSCAGALVLPLSIACNVGSQFVVARDLIARTPGRWRFAFFDREPHALFGEDVKTRNAIMLWSRDARNKTPTIATGPLRKWRGDNRAAMFKSLRFTLLDCTIRAGIPKIEGDRQAAALKALTGRWTTLAQAVHRIERLPLSSAMNADDMTVFVGPTAYNFLNVFLRPPRDALQTTQVLSEHPLHAVRCTSSRDAFAVFAVLSSHLAYWWWHAHADGFHVSGRFIAHLPFGLDTVAGPTGEALSECGKELWTAIKFRPIVSRNGGRTSLAYMPNGHEVLRRNADQRLAELAGLPAAFVDELQHFTERSVSATLHETTDSEPEGI